MSIWVKSDRSWIIEGMNRGPLIHKWIGLGDALFLSWHDKGIKQIDLYTEDIDTAKKNAIAWLRRYCLDEILTLTSLLKDIS